MNPVDPFIGPLPDPNTYSYTTTPYTPEV
jgi:hypothetical protein